MAQRMEKYAAELDEQLVGAQVELKEEQWDVVPSAAVVEVMQRIITGIREMKWRDS